ncbi:MAG: response regulator [Zoogloea sp.]|jgi:DNA-binding response OmpR family regulator|nr:response regulator [Zoogloea sp.]MBP7393982.1 response regulator [Zoogloea sp.]
MKSIVLVVEDQPDIRKLIRMTLDFGDFEVHEAENGVSGLRMLGAVRPNIVLLDVMMPGELDGFQVCRKIKEASETGGTMVVMLTARGQQADLNAGRDAGADAYLTKPFSPLELIDKVESLLEQQARETV